MLRTALAPSVAREAAQLIDLSPAYALTAALATALAAARLAEDDTAAASNHQQNDCYEHS